MVVPLELQLHTETIPRGNKILLASEELLSAAALCEEKSLVETKIELVAKTHDQNIGLSQASNQLSPPSSKVVLVPERKPVFFVTDEDGTPIYELRMRRRKRQIVIKVHDPEVELYEFNRYIVRKLREYIQIRLDIDTATVSPKPD
jgi:hypothetical protein